MESAERQPVCLGFKRNVIVLAETARQCSSLSFFLLRTSCFLFAGRWTVGTRGGGYPIATVLPGNSEIVLVGVLAKFPTLFRIVSSSPPSPIR